MQLSEAIRLGAMVRPKADGYFFHDGASCAQGAALEAVGMNVVASNAIDCHIAMMTLWPWTDQIRVQCPACRRHDHVRSLLPHLNNSGCGDHDWTREAIADFVATIEPPDPARDVAPALTDDAVATPVDERQAVHSRC